ncbi:hypothetical protein [Paracoccus sp. IB05]|uniref:hypothetical protein n=1 Tax=Paracoccus sp. IB05 TaxID=2779367 RepID=UPI0018E7DE50|nr:hypothetical protein [Paracoccus sp. IB05]MBJ2152008.1 hypothetical protein [Paracoccus sp. IB05]
MSLFVSTPRGTRLIGAKTLTLTTLAWCLVPSLIGGIGWILMDLTAGPGTGQSLGQNGSPGQSALQMLFYLLFLSPLILGPFWVAIGIGTAMLCKYGAYGSLSAVIWGAFLGGGAAMTTGIPTLIAIGAILATFHRFTLALLRPGAF